MQIFKGENQKKLVILLGVILLIDAYFLLTKAAIGGVGNFIANGNLKRDIATVREDEAKTGEYMKRKENLLKVMAEYEKLMPREKEIPAFLKRISQIAGDASVDILNILPVYNTKMQEADQRQLLKEIPIKVNARCSYHQLGTFINLIERDRRFMEISGLKIEADPANPLKHNVNLIISTFIMKEEQNAQTG